MAKPRLTGPPAKYRGKVRKRPVVITLTPDGHAALATGLLETGLSLPDYIETLIRRRRLPKQITA